MDDEFEQYRSHLHAVAYRMLGSTTEADDAVQEAWIRLNRSDVAAVDNLGGWLTTVVGRICLDMLRARASRRETPVDDAQLHVVPDAVADPEREAVVVDALGLALLVVLETLTPAERVAFVLHDLFGVPFDEVATIVDRSPDAARQLASRARRRVQGAAPGAAVDRARQRAIVEAFLAAVRGGDFDALVAMLDPDVVLRADVAAAQMGAPAELLGADAVAGNFSGRAQAAQAALIDGAPGLVWAQRGEVRVVFDFTFTDGKITAIDMLNDNESLAALEIEVLPDA